jgi:hypothetical protein
LYRAIVSFEFPDDIVGIEDQLTSLDCLVQTYEERCEDVIQIVCCEASS